MNVYVLYLVFLVFCILLVCKNCQKLFLLWILQYKKWRSLVSPSVFINLGIYKIVYAFLLNSFIITYFVILSFVHAIFPFVSIVAVKAAPVASLTFVTIVDGDVELVVFTKVDDIELFVILS